MATKKKLEDELRKQSQQMMTQQAQIDDLMSERDRLRAERNATKKENDMIRADYRRLEDTLKQNKKKVNIEQRDVSVQSIIPDESELAHIDQAENSNRVLKENKIQNNNSISEQKNLNLNSDDLIHGILQHFQSLQVNIPLPNFEPDKTNPHDFICEFEKYCIRKNIIETQK